MFLIIQSFIITKMIILYFKIFFALNDENNIIYHQCCTMSPTDTLEKELIKKF